MTNKTDCREVNDTRKQINRLRNIAKDFAPDHMALTIDTLANHIEAAWNASTQPPQPYPSGLQKATVHVLLDTLAAAARGETLDPETCQQIEGIAKEYAHKDFTQDDVLALYDCGHRPQQHPDNAAVDAFAARMKEKLAKKRAEGRGGWEDKTQCSAEFLSQLLREHVQKGDPVDVANLAMMLCMRGEGITPATTAEFKACPACKGEPESGFIEMDNNGPIVPCWKCNTQPPQATAAEDIATAVVQEICDTEPYDHEADDCLFVSVEHLKNAVSTAFLNEFSTTPRAVDVVIRHDKSVAKTIGADGKIIDALPIRQIYGGDLLGGKE